MTADPICAQRSDDYNVVYTKMKTHNVRHIPVLEGERLYGIVSVRDLAHFYQNKLETDFLDAQQRIQELESLGALSCDEQLRHMVDRVEKYKKLSLADPLTGLYNKRYFVARLEEEVARADRYRERLSLVFCDVDHFKQVNDNHGHNVGDQILKQIARILSGGIDRLNILSRLRKSDIVARYGGEEFVAILPETPIGGAVRAADNVRESIERNRFEADGGEIRVTMSFGVAEITESIRDTAALVKAADDALYRAKELGRNRVEAAGG